MAPNQNGNGDVIELWGQQFNIVKSGLSEAQVVSFVNDLTKRRDDSVQRQEHLASLTALAERTASEAEKLAAEIKAKAKKQGQEQGAKVIADAQASAKSTLSRALAEARATAEKKAKEIESQTLERAHTLADEVKRSAEAEAKRTIDEAQAKGRHLIELKEAAAASSASALTEGILAKARKEASAILEVERKKARQQIDRDVVKMRGQLLSELDRLKSQVGGLEAHTDTDETADSKPDSVQSSRQAGRRDDLLELTSTTAGAESGELEWEVEILPPVDIMKIMNVVGEIDNLVGVARTEIVPRGDRTSILVYTKGPVRLVETLKTMSEVANVQHNPTTRDKESKPRKLTAVLSSNSH